MESVQPLHFASTCTGKKTLEENDRETLKEDEDYTMGDGMRNNKKKIKREEYSTVDKRNHRDN